MAAIVTAQANLIINATLAGTAAQATTNIKTRLGTNAPTATVAMTEITGAAYSAGGTVTAFNAASSGSATNSTSLSWANSSGSSWSITGIELWDAAPLRWWYGQWTSPPVVVASGNTFAVAAAAITLTLS